MAGVKGHVALVTGAGSPDGIGFATARALRQGGARVMITSTTKRIRDRLKELPGAPEDKAAFIADLTNGDDVAALVAETRRHFGRVDILVNNAGMVQTGRRDSASRAHRSATRTRRWHLDLNLKTCFAMTRGSAAADAEAALRPHRQHVVGDRTPGVQSEVLPPTAQPRRRSSATPAPWRSRPPSKGITANAMAPGWIASGSSPKKEIFAGTQTPVGRAGTPDEVAALALFLASKERATSPDK